MNVLLLRDVEGVIRRANATEFGLASGVFTKDIHKVWNNINPLCFLLTPYVPMFF